MRIVSKSHIFCNKLKQQIKNKPNDSYRLLISEYVSLTL